MQYVLLTLSAIVSVVHCLALGRGASKRQRTATATKPFLVPLLLLTFLSFAGHMGIDAGSFRLVVAAAVLYTMGDVLLEFHRKIAFYLGMLSFFSGHICYTAYFCSFGLDWLEVALFGAIWVVGFGYALSRIIDFKDRAWPAYMAYALMIAAMGIAAGGADFQGHWIAQTLVFFGTVAFAYSDSLIMVGMRWGQDEDRMIMITYIAANFLILSGILVLKA